MQCENLLNDLEHILRNDPPSQRLKYELLRLIEPKLRQGREQATSSTHQHLQEALISREAQSVERQRQHGHPQEYDKAIATNLQKHSETFITKDELVDSTTGVHQFKNQIPHSKLSTSHKVLPSATNTKKSTKHTIAPCCYQHDTPIPNTYMQQQSSKLTNSRSNNSRSVVIKHVQPNCQQRNVQASISQCSLRSHSQGHIPLQMQTTNMHRKSQVPSKLHESHEYASQQNIQFPKARSEAEPKTFIPYLTNNMHMVTKTRAQTPKQLDYSHSHEMANQNRIRPMFCSLETLNHNNRSTEFQQQDRCQSKAQTFAQSQVAANNIQMPTEPSHTHTPKNEHYQRYHLEEDYNTLQPPPISNSLETLTIRHNSISKQPVQQRNHHPVSSHTYIQLGGVTNNMGIATATRHSTKKNYQQHKGLPKQMISNPLNTLTNNGHSKFTKSKQQHQTHVLTPMDFNRIEALANNIRIAIESNQNMPQSPRGHSHNMETPQSSLSTESISKSMELQTIDNKSSYTRPEQQCPQYQPQSQKQTPFTLVSRNVFVDTETTQNNHRQQSYHAYNIDNSQSPTQPNTNALRIPFVSSEIRSSQPRAQRLPCQVQPHILASLEALAYNMGIAEYESSQNKPSQQNSHRCSRENLQCSAQPITNSLKTLTIKRRIISSQQSLPQDCQQTTTQPQTLSPLEALAYNIGIASEATQDRPKQRGNHGRNIYKTQRSIQPNSNSLGTLTINRKPPSSQPKPEHVHCQAQQKTLTPLEAVTHNMGIRTETGRNRLQQQGHGYNIKDSQCSTQSNSHSSGTPVINSKPPSMQPKQQQVQPQELNTFEALAYNMGITTETNQSKSERLCHHRCIIENSQSYTQPIPNSLERLVINNETRFSQPKQQNKRCQVQTQILNPLEALAYNMGIAEYETSQGKPEQQGSHEYNMVNSQSYKQPISNSLGTLVIGKKTRSSQPKQQNDRCQVQTQILHPLEALAYNIGIEEYESSQGKPKQQGNHEYNMANSQSYTQPRKRCASRTSVINSRTRSAQPGQEQNRCQAQPQVLTPLAYNSEIAIVRSEEEPKEQGNHRYNMENSQISTQPVSSSSRTLVVKNKIMPIQSIQQHNCCLGQKQTRTPLKKQTNNIEITTTASGSNSKQLSRHRYNMENSQNSTRPVSNSLEIQAIKSNIRSIQPKIRHNRCQAQPQAHTPLKVLTDKVQIANETSRERIKPHCSHSYNMENCQPNSSVQPIFNSLKTQAINSETVTSQSRQQQDRHQAQSLEDKVHMVTELNQSKSKQYVYQVCNEKTRQTAFSSQPVISKHRGHQHCSCQTQPQTFTPRVAKNIQIVNELRPNKQRVCDMETSKASQPVCNSMKILPNNISGSSTQLGKHCECSHTQTQRLAPLVGTKPSQHEIKQQDSRAHNKAVQQINLPQQIISNSLGTLAIKGKSRSAQNNMRTNPKVPRSHSQTCQQISNLQHRLQQTQADGILIKKPMDVHVIPEEFFSTGEVSIELNQPESNRSSGQLSDKSFSVKFSDHTEKTPIHFDIYPQRSDMSIISNISTQCTPLTMWERLGGRDYINVLNEKMGGPVFTEVSFREMERKIKEWKENVARNIASLKKLSNENEKKATISKPLKNKLSKEQKKQSSSSDLPSCSGNKTKKS